MINTGIPEGQEPMGSYTQPHVTATRRRRWLIGAGALVALLALVVFAGAASAALPRIPMGGNGGGNTGNAMNGNGMNGSIGRGIEAVVTGVDTGANTITLGGLPSQISTVNVNNVTLVRLQPDGTTQPAAISDFKTGSLVRVGFGRGNGNASDNTGNGNTGNGNNNGQGGRRGFNIAVTRLALVPDNVANVSGVVVASNNGTYTIATAGNLRLTIKTQGNTTYNTNRNGAATAADVKVGSRIAVSGTQAPDGISATSIHIVDFSSLGQRGNGNGANGTMPRGPMGGGNTAPTATAHA